MNRELKRVSILVLAMFVTLLVSTSIIGVFQADSLNADARNSRVREDSYLAQRGAILVAGQPVAQSVASKDHYNYQRVYSNGPLYSSVTGFFPINGAPTGIEGALGDKLSGTSNSQFFDRINSILTGKNPQGASVELTIDPVAQKAAFDALGNLQGAVVVLQPKTGRVLAMVSKPDFDPNVLAVHDTTAVDAKYAALLKAPGDPLINRTVAGNLNPPGSTFKPIVSSAAFESGDYTKDSLLPDVARLTLPQTDHVVENDNGGTCAGGGTVTINLAQINSCNIPFAELGMKLGADTIRKQAEAYGFNKELSIPIPVTPSVYPTGYNEPQTGLSAFGQASDRATPLQMAMVSAGIANGGKVMYPNMVDYIRSADLTTTEHFTPRLFSQATSQKTAATVAQMMVDGVNSGVASNARIDGVSVGGKTGTAENGPGEPYTLWFTGFAPADNPEYAIAVVVENGGGHGQSGVGNTVAAPIAKKVLEAVLNK
ncbi:peptidoglycan D,D-transpeptidase FtsI family protein [Leifsonia sp. Root112D2]|uniref:peptidoglycan D,D-transpeptidase FtsI family protein n=1 Tax=Leifsonia sp. Root112D2 TaxID=1736426 RepID=UPI0006F94087|nr:penicillin-binding transpeptidase domain-containing protein [Leifsonia sp. Root112D2]KQV06704.1 cell division protein FtsI [Leifsonia sp. Root112D2]